MQIRVFLGPVLLASAVALHAANSSPDGFGTVEALRKHSGHDARYAERLSICFVNPSEEPNRYTPPQYVESDYDFRVEFGDERTSKLVREMLEAKNASKLTETDTPGTWRLALIIEGPWAKRYLTVYANTEGDRALINGHTYAIHGALQAWLTSRAWGFYRNATAGAEQPRAGRP